MQINRTKKMELKSIPHSLQVNGQLVELSSPKVMGILNITPDSFYSGCRTETEMGIAQRVEQIISEGADFIDVGACSTRPNAPLADQDEEMARLRKGLSVIQRIAPEAVISVDTFRSDVATMCVEEFGVGIINDISAGEMDDKMFDTIARLKVPYIMMHMKGTPQTMQQAPHYEHLRAEITQYFARKTYALYERGVNDIILDPGFGFGKTVAHNFEILKYMEELQNFNLPILVGVSRKSMIYKTLGITPEDSLNGTTAVNVIALMKGANILRVHDVRECVEAVKIYNTMNKPL